MVQKPRISPKISGRRAGALSLYQEGSLGPSHGLDQLKDASLFIFEHPYNGPNPYHYMLIPPLVVL